MLIYTGKQLQVQNLTCLWWAIKFMRNRDTQNNLYLWIGGLASESLCTNVLFLFLLSCLYTTMGMTRDQEALYKCTDSISFSLSLSPFYCTLLSEHCEHFVFKYWVNGVLNKWTVTDHCQQSFPQISCPYNIWLIPTNNQSQTTILRGTTSGRYLQWLWTWISHWWSRHSWQWCR